MKNLLLAIRLDVLESIRARWFMVYSFVFISAIVLLMAFSLTESRVMGVMGLTRITVVYIQLVMVVLPLFVLISTVRSIVGSRETGVFEYLLSLPIGLSAWFWGKMLGKFVITILPVIGALLVLVLWGLVKNLAIEWGILVYYSALLMALCWCFLGLAMLISTISRLVDAAQVIAFFVWLLLILLLDMILLGVIVRFNASIETVIGLAMLNPLQIFRIALIMMFDPQLTVLGPVGFYIPYYFGSKLVLLWGIIYPLVLGSLLAAAGLYIFKSNDLL